MFENFKSKVRKQDRNYRDDEVYQVMFENKDNDLPPMFDTFEQAKTYAERWGEDFYIVKLNVFEGEFIYTKLDTQGNCENIGEN